MEGTTIIGWHAAPLQGHQRRRRLIRDGEARRRRDGRRL